MDMKYGPAYMIFCTKFDLICFITHCTVRTLAVYISDVTKIMSVFHSFGNVMAGRTVQMALMNSTVPHRKVWPSPVLKLRTVTTEDCNQTVHEGM
jgi:hypothetical protein